VATVTRYCSKCILPDTYRDISFNSEGVCNYCVDYRPVDRNLGKEALLNLLRSRTKTGPYDCVVPLSGGKDSTFVLYYIVRELGLKPIAPIFAEPSPSSSYKNSGRIGHRKRRLSSASAGRGIRLGRVSQATWRRMGLCARRG